MNGTIVMLRSTYKDADITTAIADARAEDEADKKRRKEAKK